MKFRTIAILTALIAGSMLAGTTAFTQSSTTSVKTTVTKATPTPTPIPAPTIKEDDERIVVETELVNLNVRVVDRNGRPINDLK